MTLGNEVNAPGIGRKYPKSMDRKWRDVGGDVVLHGSSTLKGSGIPWLARATRGVVVTNA
jgi:hypothetical protein